MKVTLLSDTHGYHRYLTDYFDQNYSDLIIHCGDFTNNSRTEEILDFLRWYRDLPSTHKILIPGNHEYTLDISHTKFNQDDLDLIWEFNTHYNIFYSSVLNLTIDNIKIYGFSAIPNLKNWGFYSDNISKLVNNTCPDIPDVVISHSPPYGILDSNGYEHVGSQDILDFVKDRKPKYFICGHIHEARGFYQDDHTQYYNVAIMRPDGNLNHPITIDLEI